MKRLFRIALILCLVFSCLPSVAFGGVGCQHDYSRILFEPTCTESGFTMYLCRICGKSYRDDFVPALDHDLETRFVANGGCCGEYVEHCKRCEYIHNVSTDGHGYTYGACWFCDRQEPDAVYHSVEMPIKVN